MQELRLCHWRALGGECKVGGGRAYCSFLCPASGLLCSLCLWASPSHTPHLSTLGFFPRQRLFSNIREVCVITPSRGTPVVASDTPSSGVVPLSHPRPLNSETLAPAKQHPLLRYLSFNSTGTSSKLLIVFWFLTSSFNHSKLFLRVNVFPTDAMSVIF